MKFVFLNIFILLFLTFYGCKSHVDRSQLSQVDDLPDDFGNVESSDDYNKICQSYGVPIPNRVLSDRKFWSETNRSSTKPHYGELSHGAKVYRHINSDKSGCVYILGKDLSAPDFSGLKAGAICWSNEGSACFWEQGGYPIKSLPENSEKFILSNLPEAHPFGENMKIACTSCHRGDNVTIGHGNEEMADTIFNDLSPNGFRRAIAPSFWHKNKLGSTDIQCAGSCHSIPQPTPFYCLMVSGMLNNGLMIAQELGIVDSKNANPSREDCEPFLALADTCIKIWGGQSGSVFEREVKYGLCKKYLQDEEPKTKPTHCPTEVKHCNLITGKCVQAHLPYATNACNQTNSKRQPSDKEQQFFR